MFANSAAHNKYGYIYFLLIITLVFIWGNSLLPAEISAKLSDSLMKYICSFAGLGGSGDGSSGYLRKIAHVFEFACLGIEVLFLIRYNIKKHISLAVLFGLSTALIDETIQLFSEGRGSQVKDIWIDMFGFFIGVLITFSVLKHVHYKKCSNLLDVELSAQKEDDNSAE